MCRVSPRATPLPPDERRHAIIAAAIPLIRERGFAASTADVARAAGIAEGTLFRVFPTKYDLVHAVIGTLTDPADDIAALDAVDRSLPLEQRLRFVIDQWGTRIAEVSVVMAALFASGGQHLDRDGLGDHRRHADQSAQLNEAVTRLLEPDRARLRVPPDRAAAFIRSAIFSARHPMLHQGPTLTTDDLVALLLHGISTEGSPC